MRGIIIFGEKGSGKDTVAKEIKENCGKIVSQFNIGDLCRAMYPVFLATDKWKGNERTFYVEYALKIKEYDINILNIYVFGKIVEKFNIKNINELPPDNLIIVTGGRTEEDYYYWKEKGFKVIGVTCREEIRQQRLKKRDGATQRAMDNLEKGTKEIIKMADVIIENNGTEEDLVNKIKELF